MLASEPDLGPIAVAANAREAVALAERTSPDVMVLDYHLPDEDGLSLCLRLKSTDAPPAALIYSAFADEHLAVLAIVAGADALMSKAADPDELPGAVRSLAGNAARLPVIAPLAMESAAARLEAEDLPILGMLMHRTPPAEIATTLGMDEDWLRARRWAMLKRLSGDSARPAFPSIRPHNKLGSLISGQA